MTKEVWINLPVKNVEASKIFFKEIGFSFNETFGGNPAFSACMLVGKKNTVFMLFQQEAFKNFVTQPIADTTKTAQMLISFDAESREEVEELALKVEKANGIVYSKPNESQGFMYGFAFSDLDGHCWNVLFMDLEKMKQG